MLDADREYIAMARQCTVRYVINRKCDALVE